MIVGTLSKALGSYGGYVCASREIVELLLNSARSLIFSTAPPPPAAAGALAALELLIEQPLRPQKLQAHGGAAARASSRPQGLPAVAGRTQIVPLVVGDAEASVRLCEAALARGVFAQAIRPPTVPQGSSRLRLTVMASHTDQRARRRARRRCARRHARLGVEFAPAPTVPQVPVARAA